MKNDGMKFGLPVVVETIFRVKQMSYDMRKEARSKDLMDMTSRQFLEKDYYELHLDKYVVRKTEGAYSFALSYEWMPSGTIMEHFSAWHKGRTLIPNEAQLLAMLLSVPEHRKAIQSKKGVCHWYTPVGRKMRDKMPEVGFQVLEKQDYPGSEKTEG
jgi:hypothetical protein